MNAFARVAAAVIAAATLPTASAAPTRTCNPETWTHRVDLWGVTPQLLARITAASAGADPAMAARIGNVARLEIFEGGLFAPTVILDYALVENVQEIAEGLNADPSIAAQMASPALPDGSVGCFDPGPFPAQRQVVTEYHNAALDHYFLSSSAEENAFIDSGGAGPGWSRTGESFVTYFPENCVAPRMSKAVYRFYGTPGMGANSHFFTAGPQECGLLRNGLGWSYEGRAFGAELPVSGACPPAAPVPVYRAYNMRWLQNDSNHRHTTSLATYQQMQARGWYGEGIAFCVPN